MHHCLSQYRHHRLHVQHHPHPHPHRHIHPIRIFVLLLLIIILFTVVLIILLILTHFSYAYTLILCNISPPSSVVVCIVMIRCPHAHRCTSASCMMGACRVHTLLLTVLGIKLCLGMSAPTSSHTPELDHLTSATSSDPSSVHQPTRVPPIGAHVILVGVNLWSDPDTLKWHSGDIRQGTGQFVVTIASAQTLPRTPYSS